MTTPKHSPLPWIYRHRRAERQLRQMQADAIDGMLKALHEIRNFASISNGYKAKDYKEHLDTIFRKARTAIRRVEGKEKKCPNCLDNPMEWRNSSGVWYCKECHLFADYMEAE